MTNKKEQKENECLRVALIGYGLAGSVFHAPLIKTTPGLKITGIVTRSLAKQEQAHKDFPEAKIFSTTDELWQEAKNFDLVVVASPNKNHAEQGKLAMLAGLAVVIDKPIAVSIAECEDLISTSKSTGALLSVFQNRRWDNDFLTLKKLLANNLLGELTRFESRFERYRPEPRAGAWRETSNAEEGGGLLFDLGSHLIDQATQLFGFPEKLYAEIDSRREGVESDDDCFLALTFGNGLRAHLWMSAVAASQGPRFRLLGLQGAYEKYGLDPQEDALRSGKTPLSAGWGIEAKANWGTLCRLKNNLLVQEQLETTSGAYQNFYIKMREAILDQAPVPVSPNDALNTLRIIEAAQKSARNKTTVQLAHS